MNAIIAIVCIVAKKNTISHQSVQTIMPANEQKSLLTSNNIKK